MSYAPFAQMALSTLSGIGKAKAAKKQYKETKRFKDWSNAMTDLSGALQQNTITQNELGTIDPIMDNKAKLQTQGLLATAAAEVSAAAAGVKGRSVNQSLVDIQRGVASLELNRQTALTQTRAAFQSQRQNTAIQTMMSKDYSYLPKPDTAGTILGSLMSGISSEGFGEIGDFLSGLGSQGSSNPLGFAYESYRSGGLF